MPDFPLNTLLTSLALALACAILSVIVVLRRWAFIGEGISHSGFGGAGTAWLLMLAFPALDQHWVPYFAVVIFCVGTALAIGALSRGKSVHADAAIGIFLTASLAWGFLAQQVYFHKRHASPTLFENLLFGQLVAFSSEYTLAAIAICAAVVLAVIAFWKQIIAYSFDPLLAETSGVPAGFIHYLLMVLIALLIVIGVRVAGSVLITAMLILPGATALLMSRRLETVVGASVLVALIGTTAGLLINARVGYLPAGPAMVLVLFIEFMLAWMLTRLSGRFRQRA